jgi:hypothetical protein
MKSQAPDFETPVRALVVGETDERELAGPMSGAALIEAAAHGDDIGSRLADGKGCPPHLPRVTDAPAHRQYAAVDAASDTSAIDSSPLR